VGGSGSSSSSSDAAMGSDLARVSDLRATVRKLKDETLAATSTLRRVMSDLQAQGGGGEGASPLAPSPVAAAASAASAASASDPAQQGSAFYSAADAARHLREFEAADAVLKVKVAAAHAAAAALKTKLKQ
jgi:hypothetical protein